MKNSIGMFSVVLAVWVAGTITAAEILMVEGAPPERAIKMTADDVALIVPDAIAGSEVKVTVKGDAKAKVYTKKNIGGGQPPIGPTSERVLVTPSKKGKVTVEVVIKHPTLNKPRTDTYSITVE